jgi:bifunctional non-homologous end joining protein LigD
VTSVQTLGRPAGGGPLVVAPLARARYAWRDVSLDHYKRKRDFDRTPEPSGDGTSGEAARAGSPAASAPGATPAGAPGAPGATPGSGAARGRFVVQRHRARALHYDFRLEIDGVLVSWAVPKGPTLDASVRRGAFHVEDHPLDYFDFEGTIPAGQYGAGDVIVWDWGQYRTEATDDPGRAVADGELKFELFGEKLRGRFTIVRTRGGAGRPGARSTQPTDKAEREEWLLIKKRDTAAVPGWDVEAAAHSVKTGRTNEEVAAGIAPAAAWVGNAPPEPAAPRASPVDLPGARPAPMPGFIEPMKATLTDRPFSDPAWIFELKWDGYRVQARIHDGLVTWSTRRGQNALSYFPELGGPPIWLAAREAILDGEVVALNDRGEPDFRLLQAWRSGRRAAVPAESAAGAAGGQASKDGSAPVRGAATLAYKVFDLLYLDGSSLLDVPLEDRKLLLRSIIRDSPTVQFASHIEGDGTAFHAAVAERGLEGIVAKLRRSRYEPGRRSPSWLKIKNRQEQEFVVGGWAPRAGSNSDFGALLIGVYEDDALRPAGRVGTGFDAPERARLLSMLAASSRSTSPFRPAQPEDGVHWVEPRLVARVEFAEWSADGALRAPSYKGLDLDADPTAVVRETAKSTDVERRAAQSVDPSHIEPGTQVGATPELLAERSSREAALRGTTISSAAPTVAAEELAALDALPPAGGKWTVGGRELKLSNLDKPIWPGDSIVKRDLIRYYASIAPFALPYLRDRALTVVRHPNGIDRPGFWQKQLPGHTPSWVARWSWRSVSAEEIRDYAVADSAATLAWLANEAAIDLHPSTYKVEAPDRPTWALIDIDPGERTTWDEVLMLARLYRTALGHLGVTGFPKVSGQRGIQVWIPIRPGYTFEATRDWVLGVSRAVGAAVPELVSWEWEKTRRGGLARLDYTQNAFNKTLVAPYAARPAAGAPVSAPISWAELEDPTLKPNGWTIRSIFDRLAVRGDLFAPSLTIEQELPAL